MILTSVAGMFCAGYGSLPNSAAIFRFSSARTPSCIRKSAPKTRVSAGAFCTAGKSASRQAAHHGSGHRCGHCVDCEAGARDRQELQLRRQQRCRRRQDLSVIDETEAQKYAASAADAAERLAGSGQCVFETTECAGAQIILRQPPDGQQIFDKQPSGKQTVIKQQTGKQTLRQRTRRRWRKPRRRRRAQR